MLTTVARGAASPFRPKSPERKLEGPASCIKGGCANVRATSRRKVSPMTKPRTRPFGLRGDDVGDVRQRGVEQLHSSECCLGGSHTGSFPEASLQRLGVRQPVWLAAAGAANPARASASAARVRCSFNPSVGPGLRANRLQGSCCVGRRWQPFGQQAFQKRNCLQGPARLGRLI